MGEMMRGLERLWLSRDGVGWVDDDCWEVCIGWVNGP
jgi:hypothetical protein